MKFPSIEDQGMVTIGFPRGRRLERRQQVSRGMDLLRVSNKVDKPEDGCWVSYFQDMARDRWLYGVTGSNTTGLSKLNYEELAGLREAGGDISRARVSRALTPLEH